MREKERGRKTDRKIESVYVRRIRSMCAFDQLRNALGKFIECATID